MLYSFNEFLLLKFENTFTIQIGREIFQLIIAIFIYVQCCQFQLQTKRVQCF